jgi:hypothetical protein
MPVPGFLSSFADKAQSAINASPLAAHLPGRPTSPDSQPAANDAAAQGGYRSHALDAIQYQFRAFGQQYSGTSPVQKIITSEKGVAIDFDSVSRAAKAQSKELYTWGQGEGDDIKDVSDRLAYLNFVQGSLASSLAVKLDVARAPLKALRDAETAITPRRNLRAGLQLQLSRLEHEQQRGNEKKMQELKEQIARVEQEDESHEKEVEILKRKGVRESEQLKWEAVREYGEKLVLLSQAAASVIQVLPATPPSAAQPYAGVQATAAARASLQRALDNYKTGHINLPSSTPDLHRSDTRSFGETHASELSSISSESVHGEPGIPITPPSYSRPLSPQHAASHPSPLVKADVPDAVAPIDPKMLNQATASIPALSTSPVAPSNVEAPASSPTVAETGVPLSAGAAGPGPASGSLHDIKGASSSAGPRSGGLPGSTPQAPAYGQQGAGFAGSGPVKYESAEDEKKRLQKEEREGILAGSGGVPAAKANFESAEDEKKRLEREERERLLASGSTPGAKPTNESAEDEKKRLEREEREKVLRAGASQSEDAPQEDLPPYQDY